MPLASRASKLDNKEFGLGPKPYSVGDPAEAGLTAERTELVVLAILGCGAVGGVVVFVGAATSHDTR